ncbi:uncharacterized protein TNCV_99421 [Trichonephila clavipes]|nr:uncharacterized protein TNCV_99421 [Trichonephila clavipes]
MSLSHKSEVEVYTTSVIIRPEGQVIRTPLLTLPYSKGNRTLLGIEFLQKARIVLNLRHRNWFLCDTPRRTYDFVKELILQEVQSRPSLEENTCLLREDEVKCLIPEQRRNELGEFLDLCGTVFEPGGNPTPFITNTVSTPETIIMFRCLPNFQCIEILVHLLHLFLSLSLLQQRVTMQDIVYSRHHHFLVKAT